MVSEKEVDVALSGWHRALIDAHDEPVDERRRRCIRAALSAAARVREEDNAEEPVAWGEDIDGKIVSVRLDKSRHCTVPLYPAPQPSGTVEDLLDEGLEILNALIDNIKRCGNYSPDATCTFIDQAGQCLREALSALTAGKPEQVPSGWKLVPEEPTEEMYRAVYKVQDDCAIHNYGASPTFDDYWSAALSASPAAPTAGGGDE